METYLVRLKPYEPRRGVVLRRYSYRGIAFHEARGWYRVTKEVADYLRGVRQIAGDIHSAPAFDVCSEEEAGHLEAQQASEAQARKKAAEAIDATIADEAKPPRRKARAD